MTFRSELPFDLLGVDQSLTLTCTCGQTYRVNFRKSSRFMVLGLPLIACLCGATRDTLVGRAIEAARAARSADRPPKGIYISDRRIQAIEGTDGRMIPNTNARVARRAR